MNAIQTTVWVWYPCLSHPYKVSNSPILSYPMGLLRCQNSCCGMPCCVHATTAGRLCHATMGLFNCNMQLLCMPQWGYSILWRLFWIPPQNQEPFCQTTRPDIAFWISRAELCWSWPTSSSPAMLSLCTPPCLEHLLLPPPPQSAAWQFVRLGKLQYWDDNPWD